MRACLDCSQNHTTVRMLELRNDTFAYMLAFSFIDSIISSQRIQNGDPSPFRTFIQGNEEFLKDRRVDGKEAFLRSGSTGCKVDVRESGNRVRNDLEGRA